MFTKVKTITLLIINILYKGNMLSVNDKNSLKLIAKKLKEAKTESSLANILKALLLLDKNIDFNGTEKNCNNTKLIYNFIKRLSNATKNNKYFKEVDKLYNETPVIHEKIVSVFNDYTQYLEDFFTETNKERIKYHEISEVLDTMFETIAQLPKSNNNFNEKLFELKEKLEKTNNIKNVKKLKESLVSVISEVQEEITTFNNSMNTILEDNLKFANSKIKALENQVDKVISDSYRDPLTNALNRKWLEDNFDDFFWFEKDNNNLFIILDIDHFKLVNDTYGHAAGDFALKETVKRFKEVLRGNTEDKIIRYGGDEFILILTNVRENYIDSILNRFIKAINSKSFEVDNKLMNLSISVGASMFTEEVTPKGIFDLTDKKLYKAKKSGRNCFVKEI